MAVILPLPDPPAPDTGSPVLAPLTGAYRPIRRVAPPQAPVAGVLAAAGERRVLLADADAVWDRVFLGRPEPPHHLFAPTDLVRRSDGHDVELPWCREPVARLLDARAAAGRPLSGGELVTLVVSALRGTREAWEGIPPESEPPAGRWWIDDDGRPLFAPAEDGGAVAAEASALLGQAAAHTKDRVLLRLIEEGRDVLERPRRLRRTLEPLEDALFEACAPRSIERAAEGTSQRGARLIDLPDDEPARASTGIALTGLIERFTDAGFAEMVGDAIDRTRTAARRALGGGRRLPMLVGATAAAAVIVGGLLWPSDPEPADADDGGGPARAVEADEAKPAAAPSGTPTATATPVATGAPLSEDAQTAAVRLRDAVAECAAHGDPLCAAVRDDPVEPLPEGVLEVAGSRGEVVLLDDYGDVAVFRLDGASGEGAAVLLQIVRLDARWLLRSAQTLGAAG